MSISLRRPHQPGIKEITLEYLHLSIRSLAFNFEYWTLLLSADSSVDASDVYSTGVSQTSATSFSKAVFRILAVVTLLTVCSHTGNSAGGIGVTFENTRCIFQNSTTEVSPTEVSNADFSTTDVSSAD